VSDLNDIAERVLGWANDGEQLEVYVGRGVGTEVVAYEGNVESLSRAEGLGASVRVVKDGRLGFSYTESFDEAALRETLTEARDNATFATYDEFAGLAEPDGAQPVSLDVWNDEARTFSTDDKVAMAIELEKLVRSGDARIRNVKSSTYSDGMSEAAIASTTGIRAALKRASCYVSTYAIAGDENETQTGGGYSVARRPSLLDVEVAANDAIDRATRLLGATRPKSDTVTVVFDNRVTPTLMAALAGALNGESVLKGRSFLAGDVGKYVGVSSLTFTDDPTNPLAYSASPYDGEGLATRRNTLIENGVLQGFLYDSYAGRRAGRASNAAAVRGGFKGGPSTGARALSLAPGHLSQAEIITKIDNGVLVQGVLGAGTGGINGISGDVSLGAEGLLIRGGEVVGPVREFTIASNLRKMLMDIAYIGNDTEWLPGAAAGVTLAVSDMSLGGT
jgi:PmbA protein